ncbi:MAG: ABC transporter permease [Anaerolineae bacterium]|nr:ABC transporter permease [Anaerolineae bacterium]
MLNQVFAVAGRVLRQLVHDRRFLALSLIVPVLLIYIMAVFFEAVDNPIFSADDFIPPVGAFLVHFLTYVLSAIVLVRERTQQTMTRMFVSGYRRGSIIMGYVLAYTVLATLQSLIVIIELQVLFDLGFTTLRFFQMYLVIWMLAIISIALGIFVSNFARNEGQVLPMMPLILVPSIFFSGMIVAVDKMPAWVGWFSFLTPMYYANNVIGAIIADDTVTMLLVWLLVYGAVVMSLAVLTLREQN